MEIYRNKIQIKRFKSFITRSIYIERSFIILNPIEREELGSICSVISPLLFGEISHFNAPLPPPPPT